jgi:RNA polymerase sigma-70 factor (ECF subfamily)
MVFTLSLKLLGDREEAEEVAQDVFVKCYKSLSKYKNESKFSTWLYRIAYNTNMDVLRARKRTIPLVEVLDINHNYQETSKDALQFLIENDKRNALQDAIASLSKEEQVILLLYYYEEIPLKEISEIVNLSESNVKVKLHRSRKHIYQLLENNTVIGK